MRKLTKYRLSDLNPNDKFRYHKGRKIFIFYGIRNGNHVYHDESGIEHSVDLGIMNWTKSIIKL
jgi:uncharacterized protein affecting Mg2+/Co2+ transport